MTNINSESLAGLETQSEELGTLESSKTAKSLGSKISSLMNKKQLQYVGRTWDYAG